LPSGSNIVKARDTVDVVRIDAAATRRPLIDERAKEVKFTAAVLDDQVVPLVVRSALVRESEAARARCRRLEITACEERDGTSHCRRR
jgi:hypothetical protein